MKLRAALYRAVHDYKPGVDKLADLLGIAESTLQNKANPRIANPEWKLIEILQTMQLTGDLRIAHSFCAEAGGMFLPLGEGVEAGSDVFRLATDAAKNLGELMGEVQQAMADGRVSQHELERVHQASFRMSRALHALDAFMEHAAQGPASPLSVVKK